MNDRELFETLIKTPSSTWKQNNNGIIAANKNADIVIAKAENRKGFDAFYSLKPEDLQLVLHKGEIRLFDEEIKAQLSANDFSIKEFSKIFLNGKTKYVYGDLGGLISKILSYYPKVIFPVSQAKKIK